MKIGQLAIYRGQRVIWFRFYGYGLHVKLAKGHRKLFSERNGYRKAYYFCGLRFELLGRSK